MIRGSMKALAKCARSVSRRRRHGHQVGSLLVSGLVLSRLRSRVKRGVARRLIRKFLAGVAAVLNPGADHSLVPAPVPVRIRARRR